MSVEGGSCTAARVAVGGATGTPVEAAGVSDALVGSPPSPDSIAAAAATVPGALGDALGDVYASSEYRTHLAGVLAKRALTAAFARTGT